MTTDPRPTDERPSHEQPADDLPTGLAQAARRALETAGYHRLADLHGVPEAQVRGLHGVGPRAVRLLKLALAARGLALAD